MTNLSQRGFTLIEILVSVAIFGIMATSVFYVLTSQSQMGARNTDLTRAVHMGKRKLDSLKVSEYEHLTAGTDTLDDRFVRAWYISTVMDSDGNSTGRKKIDLNVFWPLTGEHSTSFATLVSDDQYKENP